MVPLGDEDVDRAALRHAELELRVILDARVVVAPARAPPAHPLALGLPDSKRSGVQNDPQQKEARTRGGVRNQGPDCVLKKDDANLSWFFNIKNKPNI